MEARLFLDQGPFRLAVDADGGAERLARAVDDGGANTANRTTRAEHDAATIAVIPDKKIFDRFVSSGLAAAGCNRMPSPAARRSAHPKVFGEGIGEEITRRIDHTSTSHIKVDGTMMSETAFLDTSALTGESLRPTAAKPST